MLKGEVFLLQVKEYISRAEELKQLLKPTAEPMPSGQNNPRQPLDELSK